MSILSSPVHIFDSMHLRHYFFSLVDLVWAFKHLTLTLLTYLIKLWCTFCIIGDKLHLPVGVDPCHLHRVMHQCGLPIWEAYPQCRHMWSSWGTFTISYLLKWWLHLYPVGVLLLDIHIAYRWPLHPFPLVLMWFMITFHLFITNNNPTACPLTNVIIYRLLYHIDLLSISTPQFKQ